MQWTGAVTILASRIAGLAGSGWAGTAQIAENLS